MIPIVLAACLAGPCIAAAASSPGAPRHHSLTVMAPNDGAKAFNSSFGSGNWKALSPYIDLLLIKRSPEVPASMKTAMYQDFGMCSNLTGPGHNDYPGPDCSQWPSAAFYAQPGHPERLLSAKFSGFLQRPADPASGAMRDRALSSVRAALATGDNEFVYLDDSTPPEEGYGAFCWGTPSFEKGTGECEGAAGGRARPPYGGGPEAWVRGMSSLIEAMPRPVIVNGLAGYAGHGPSVTADLVARAPNAWGAACDDCFYGNAEVPTNKFLWAGPLFRARLDGALRVTAAGKNVIVVNDAVTDPTARERALAEVMLFYDADRTWFWGAICGERSHIHACPEAALTFYRPDGAYPAGDAALEAEGGTLVREFQACYESGRSLGPCAAVVNPDPYVESPRPPLHRAYAHRLRILGSSLCDCYGDSGSVRVDGPPLGEKVPAASGYVLFR